MCSNVGSGVEATLYLSQPLAVLNLPHCLHFLATPLSQSPISTTAASTHHSQSLLQSPQYKYTCVLSAGSFVLLHYRAHTFREHHTRGSALSAIRCLNSSSSTPTTSFLLDSRSSSYLYFSRNPKGGSDGAETTNRSPVRAKMAVSSETTPPP